MSRKKQCLIFIILIPLLGFSFLRLGGYFLSAEEVLYACERGLHYGPSEKIVAEIPLEDGGVFVVGVGEDFLSAVPAERAFGVLWKLKSGSVTGYIPAEKTVTAEVLGGTGGTLAGLTTDDNIKEVFFDIEYYEGTTVGGTTAYNEKDKAQLTVAADEDGLFVSPVDITLSEDGYFLINYTAGYDNEGNIIYQDGLAPDGTVYINGEVYIYEGE